MASIQFTDVQVRPTEFLDLTSLTLDEFQQLIPPFEAAFQAHMAAWRLDGKPRTARRFTVYKNCPLGFPEELEKYRAVGSLLLVTQSFARGARKRTIDESLWKAPSETREHRGNTLILPSQ